MAPLAQGAAAKRSNKEKINRYLKETGLTTQKLTIGQFWAKVRHVYPPVLLKQLDPWMKIHQNEMMPRIEASSFKDSDNKEQVRLVLSKDSENHTLTFTGDEDKPLKADNVTLTKKELYDFKNFNKMAEKIANEDPLRSDKDSAAKSTKKDSSKKVVSVKVKRILTGKELAKMSLHQQMEYMFKMREASDAADRVLETQRKPAGSGASFEYEKNKNSETVSVAFLRALLGADAEAKTGGPKKELDADFISLDVPKSEKAQTPNQISADKIIQGNKPTNKSVQLNDKQIQKKPDQISRAPLTTNKKRIRNQSSGSDNRENGTNCIVSGWVSIYNNNRCASPLKGRENLLSQIDQLKANNFSDGVISSVQSCVLKKNGLPCNPLLFGFDNASGSSEPFCITGSPDVINKATEKCSQKSPLKTASDQEKIIKSIVKAKGDKEGLCSIKEKDGKSLIKKDCAEKLGSYMNDLKDHYLTAAQFCLEGSNDGPMPPTSEYWDAHAKQKGNPPGLRKDQKEACDNLKDRYFALQVEVEDKIIDAPPMKPQEPVKGDPQFNNQLSGPKVPPEDECGFWCKNKGWFIGAGIGLAALGLVWWLVDSNDNDSTTPVYVPPAAPPLPPPVVTPVTPPIDPPPVNPCPAPNTMINGVCTTPVITPPVIPPSEAGTGSGPQGFGGVR
jgi:hypothetical protein